MKQILTQSRLKELLDYNPETGLFKWRKGFKGTKQGALAGYQDSRGAIDIRVDYRLYRAHRLAWLFMEGYTPTNLEIDHIDRNPNNNRWSNLRLVSHTCNLRNQKVSSRNKTGVTGVGFHKAGNKWRAYICFSGTSKTTSLGLFSMFEDAVMARWKAEVSNGFLNCNTTSSAYLFLQSKGMV